MKVDEDSGGMWCLVMFDLPVQTKQQRHAAVVFRDLLLDMGYCMIQFSVYARYTPTAEGNRSTVRTIKDNLPPQGKIRVLHITDKQWSKSLRYVNLEEENDGETPKTLMLF
ncbi:CRISPR-associated endonuclease Cas2 [Alloscardovia omnicolens]|jgi:CRISPR-associated endoribonuclease cas2|uniref:CRISPR-associated endoribonuclease Cas2 n=3 Tax=Alloscardovia omnicolens TaxID=419015 RepID=U1RB05_9BIFI|nr:CRISPR-associated endonuclease Cas2 [Alloscardovia omnicolens]ERH30759.1 CRISPR-associated endoribonuclease Cas2 [Alloscardovia omnicolens F0580]MDK6249185.1 CRISPR-associated endonuclease Cas2 [Alloscardovia omnicolens]MDK6642785.1 CRISPR-associated endonuclease Cas2 [Alloscardovia omnicolens]MDK6662986.1 CRISPR-associated endonuclease Cas2 [Alloscardovia omnicolens]MDK7747525.1 CRISPR-associated endonuclease Cas2 [Alloscardovia omnicolens]